MYKTYIGVCGRENVIKSVFNKLDIKVIHLDDLVSDVCNHDVEFINSGNASIIRDGYYINPALDCQLRQNEKYINSFSELSKIINKHIKKMTKYENMIAIEFSDIEDAERLIEFDSTVKFSASGKKYDRFDYTLNLDDVSGHEKNVIEIILKIQLNKIEQTADEYNIDYVSLVNGK